MNADQDSCAPSARESTLSAFIPSDLRSSAFAFLASLLGPLCLCVSVPLWFKATHSLAVELPPKPKGRLHRCNLPRRKTCCSRCLALRELEAASRLRLAVLLALDHAAVAGEEAALLQHGP